MRYLFVLLFVSAIAFAQALPSDQYGRTVTMVTQSGNDVYTVSASGVLFTVSFPTGTGQATVYGSINTHAPAGYVPSPPSIPLDEQYTPSQYGQYLITQFTSLNAQRGLTSSQLFTLAQNLGPYYILLQTGALQSFLDNLGNIPIDGVLITTAIVTQFQTAVQAYLNGD
jgi:hypothetical protein